MPLKRRQQEDDSPACPFVVNPDCPCIGKTEHDPKKYENSIADQLNRKRGGL